MGPGKRDWGNTATVRVEQEASGNVEHKRPAPLASLGKAFAILHELGISPDTEQGQKLIAESGNCQSHVLDAESQPVSKQNTDGETEGQTP